MNRHHFAIRAAMQPIYNLRGRMVTRMFRRGQPLRQAWWEQAIRSACERVLDVVEMWQMKPAFDRMQRQMDECDRIHAELVALRQKFGLETIQATEGETRR